MAMGEVWNVRWGTGRHLESKSLKPKKNTIRKDGVFFLVGDGGFEPPKA